MKEAGRWDLNPLYQGLDDPRIEEDFGRLTKLVEKSRLIFEPERETVGQVAAGIRLAEHVDETVRYLAAYLSLVSSADTSISQTTALLNRLRGIMAEFAGFDVRFKRLVEGLDIDRLVEEEDLGHYAFFLAESKKEAVYLLDAQLE